MRYSWILIFSMLLTGLSSYAQKPTHTKAFDSLLYVYEQYPKDDTVKLNILDKLIHLQWSDTPYNHKYADVSIKLADQLKDTSRLINALCQKGHLYGNSNNPLAEIKLYLRAKATAEKSKNGSNLPNTLCILAWSYLTIGQQNKAIECVLKAVAIVKQTIDTSMIVNCQQLAAAIYKESGNLIKAQEYNRSNVLLSKQRGTRESLYYTFLLAQCYVELKNSDSAIANFKIALQLSKEQKDSGSASFTLGELGSYYLKQRELHKAIACLFEGLLYNSQNDAWKDIDLMRIGICYHQLGRYDSAIYYYKRCLALIPIINNRIEVMDSLRVIYEKQHKLPEAYQLCKQINLLSDSMRREKDQDEIKNKSAINYDFTARIAADSIQTADAEKIQALQLGRQKSYTIGGLVGLGLAVLLLFFVYRNYNNQRKANDIIAAEKQTSENLLLNILPSEVADELKASGSAKAKLFNDVTVLFTDFVGFTTVSERLSPEALVKELHECFKAFDGITAKYNIEKIKTVGDAYLAAAGLPLANAHHAIDAVRAAIEIRDYMLQRRIELGEATFEVRIGLHSGKVVAGIVGVKKFAYDIWGDTVNTAARMEQNSEAGKINISGTTYELVKEAFTCTHRGKIAAKNKGEIDMYYVG